MTFTLQELAESAKEQRWKQKGVADEDIAFSRLCGMDAEDTGTFRRFTAEQSLLIIVRCPKTAARTFHGIFRGKPASVKHKTGTSGVVVTDDGKAFVSDYDLMGAWRRGAGRYEKIRMSAENGAPNGPWSIEGMTLARQLNKALVTRLQHGAQDDFHALSNPGVKAGDHFAAFNLGRAGYLSSVAACAQYYKQNNLEWPYLANGRHIAAK